MKRLDLDAAKSRTRKLTGDKLMQAIYTHTTQHTLLCVYAVNMHCVFVLVYTTSCDVNFFSVIFLYRILQAEVELRVAQAEFDVQLSKVRDGTKKAIQTHVHYMGYLKSFMSAQKDYHQECLSQLESIDTMSDFA